MAQHQRKPWAPSASRRRPGPQMSRAVDLYTARFAARARGGTGGAEGASALTSPPAAAWRGRQGPPGAAAASSLPGPWPASRARGAADTLRRAAPRRYAIFWAKVRWSSGGWAALAAAGAGSPWQGAGLASRASSASVGGLPGPGPSVLAVSLNRMTLPENGDV